MDLNFPSVYVVILNYNHQADLQETIESFENQNYPNLEIVVSDNGSTDYSIEWLRANKPNVHLIENGENLGWAQGNNVGIDYALKQDAYYILLANNDLWFDSPSVISQLVQSCRLECIDIVGPKQMY